jgi:uncharacterized membrane protein
MDNEYSFTQKEIEEGKVLAGIAYFGIIGFLIAYLAGKENRFTLYHAQQGLLIAIASLLVIVPVIGWFILSIFVLVLSIIGLINGFSGKVKPLPLIGKIGFKFNMVKPEMTATPQEDVPPPPA